MQGSCKAQRIVQVSHGAPMPRTKIMFICKHCGEKRKKNSSSSGLFCSNKCQQDHYFMSKYIDWVNGNDRAFLSTKSLRRAVIYRYGYSCQECGIYEWNNSPITLEIEHINGNSEDNSPDNLTLLCPNCHSQTPTYRAKNKGNGRHKRRIRYSQGKSF